MQRYVPMLVVLTLFVLVGCSSGGNSPVAPNTTDLTSIQNQLSDGQSGQFVNQTNEKALWGLWDVYWDAHTGDLQVTPLRTAQFRANVNTFMNSGPNLLVEILDESELMTEGKITVDVGLRHPFPGLYEYSGFDVWGIFLHNGSQSLDYDTDLVYGIPDNEFDAILLNADGYTRWWNRTDFPAPGVLGYTPGNAGNLPNPTATLNAYKAFGDGLDTDGDYATFLADPDVIDQRAAFISGSTNYRTYELQFPMVGGFPAVRFQYAVAASWEAPEHDGDSFIVEGGGDEYTFYDSAVAAEAICFSVVDNSTLYYDGSVGGGQVTFDVEIFDWGALSTSMADEIGQIQIECRLFDDPYVYDQAALATLASGGGSFSSVYSFDLACNAPINNDDVGVWIIAEQAVGTYDNDYGAPAPGDPLASFYRLWTPVLTEGAEPPVLVSGVDGQDAFCNNSIMDYTVEATGDITGYMWSVVPTGNAKSFTISDDDTLSFDFGTVAADADYDVDCRIYNGPAFVQATTLTVTVPPNNPPAIISGVDGPDSTIQTTADYTITASDISAESAVLFEDDFASDQGWAYTSGDSYNWAVTGGSLQAGAYGTYGLNSTASYTGITVPDGVPTLLISYLNVLNLAESGCTYDVAWMKLNQDGGSWDFANSYGSFDTPPQDCTNAWGTSYGLTTTTWTVSGFANSELGIQFGVETGDTFLNSGNWTIDDLLIEYYVPCGTLDYTWSVVDTGDPANYNISDDYSLTIDWSTYGPGVYDVNCEVSDGTMTAEGTPLTVTVTDDSCTNGMFATNLGTGTHDQAAVYRMDLAFLYGGSHAGECLINEDYCGDGTNWTNQQGAFHYFDADTTGAKTTSLLFNAMDEFGSANGSVFVFDVDEQTHNYIASAVAVDGDDLMIYDQTGTVIFYNDVSHVGGRFNPIQGITWDDDGVCWFACICANGTIQGYPEDDLIHLRWIDYDGSTFSFDQVNGGNILDITSAVGFDITTDADLFDIEYISTLDEIWVFEGGTDDRGAVHRYTADPSGPTFIGSLTTLFSEAMDIHTPVEYYGYPDEPCYATGGDIAVDRAATGADICRIVIFGNMGSGGAEIMKYSSGSFGDTVTTAEQYAAMAFNNQNSQLTFLHQGNSATFSIWDPPGTW